MIYSEDIVALITARKNSQSIKNKSMVNLGGKPLIKFSIDTCKNSKLINRIILSSDSNQIMNYASKNGVEVLFQRPAKLAKKYSNDLSVLKHFVLF